MAHTYVYLHSTKTSHDYNNRQANPRYLYVLRRDDGKKVQVTDRRLRSLRDQGRLTLGDKS